MRSEQSFDAFTSEQKRIIARFLEFMALGACQDGTDSRVTEQDAQVAYLADQAWQSYWFKFSQRLSKADNGATVRRLTAMGREPA